MLKTVDVITAEDLRSGRRLLGAWCHTTSPVCAEILAKSGYEVIVPDMEHGPYSLPTLTGVLQAIESRGCFAMVRAPWNDMVRIKQILDCGAHGIHVPYVQTAEEAAYAVRSCKYPMDGWRGVASNQRATDYGMDKANYFARANCDVIVMIAIETPEGVRNARAIAATEGVDGIFIGPNDLATSMGHMADPSQPDVREAIRTVEEAALAEGKFLASIAAPGADAQAKFDRGYSLLYVFSDTSGLAQAALAARRNSVPAPLPDRD